MNVTHQRGRVWEPGRLAATWWSFALLGMFAVLALGACADEGTTAAPDAGIDVDPDLVIPPPDLPRDGGQSLVLAVARIWPDEPVPPQDAFADCPFASPLLHVDGEGARTLIVAASDEVRGLDPESGAPLWSVALPAPDEALPFLVATPVIVPEADGGSLLVVAYHTSTDPAGRNVSGPKFHHYAAVIDLEAGALDTRFEVVELTGAAPANSPPGQVPFSADNALARGTLVHAGASAEHAGFVYVTFGNTRDIQPWHGWLYELDLGAWRANGASAAIRSLLVTTPEVDCGPAGQSGSRERRCGGGLWAPSGPLLVAGGEPTDYALILSPGNGQLDPTRRDYANTLMRVRSGESGLAPFDPDCDDSLCADFDPDEPSSACAESCANLWIPQLEAADTPDSVSCVGLTPLECWGRLDYVGGSSPVLAQVPDGPDVLVYPTKEGAVYLVDADHLGVQYERRGLVSTCGAPGDPCRLDWAGMIVTQPALTEVGGDPLAIVPTFMPDNTHPAGVVALRIVLREGRPAFEPYWQFPPFDTAEAVERFRGHPSRVALSRLEEGGQVIEVAWLVEARQGGRGRLLGLDVSSGEALVDEPLAGPGLRFARPLVDEGRIYLNSCTSDEGPGHIEAWEIVLEVGP